MPSTRRARHSASFRRHPRLLSALAMLLVVPALGVLLAASGAEAAANQATVAVGTPNQNGMPSTSLNTLGQLMASDSAGDVFNVTGGGITEVWFTPRASGTYFNQSMTAGDSYIVLGGGTSSSFGVLGTSEAIPSSVYGVATDGAGDLFFEESTRVLFVPSSAGTYYGQSMVAGDVYSIVGNGTSSSSPDPFNTPASSAAFNFLRGIAVDASGDIFLSDMNEYLIYEIPASSGTYFGNPMTADEVYMVAGDSMAPSGAPSTGTSATSTAVAAYSGVAVGSDGLYFGDGNYVALVPFSSGTYYGQSMTVGDLYLIAGNGISGSTGDGAAATSAEIQQPYGLAVDTAGNVFMESAQSAVRCIAGMSATQYGVAMTGGDIYDFVGSESASGYSGLGGSAAAARVTSISAVAVSNDGAYLTATVGATSHAVLIVPNVTGTVYGQSMTAGGVYAIVGTFAAPQNVGVGGPATTAPLQEPGSVAIDPAGDEFIAASGANAVDFVPAASGTFFGQAMTAGNLYLIAGDGLASPLSSPGSLATSSTISPGDVATDAAGDLLVTDGHSIAFVPRVSGTYYGQSMTAGDLYFVAGNGSSGGGAYNGDPATGDSLGLVDGVTADASGDFWFTDNTNNCVAFVPAASGTFYGRSMTVGDDYVVAGTCRSSGHSANGTVATSALLSTPKSIAVDSAGDMTISEQNNTDIRFVPAASGTYFGQSMTGGDIYTLKTGIQASVSADANGNVYVSWSSNVFLIPITSGTYYGQSMTAGAYVAIAGTGTPPTTWPGSGAAPTSTPLAPSGKVAVTASGAIFVSDADTYVVWDLAPPASAPTITSGTAATFTTGTAGTFTVTTTGYPTPSITETGSLPSGVTFTDNGDGTASLAGTPSTSGSYPITITASNGTAPNATQSFTLSVGTAPAITSAASTAFTSEASGSFTFQTTGSPTPSLTETGTLPSGVTFTDNGDGTASLAGTPTAGSAGAYNLSITAANGIGTAATQSFVLDVDQAPAFISGSNASFADGVASTFTVSTAGYPAPSITETGTLPAGVSFTDNGNGTATLAGTPTQTGAFPLSISASNGVGSAATQSFSLKVTAPPAFTNGTATTFTSGTAGTYSFTTSGYPAPGLTETGTLPSGVTFTDNGNGTASLAGTPAAASGGAYNLSVSADNGVGSPATQSFALTVDAAPGISSASSTTFSTSSANSFVVQTSGYPTPSLTETGTLPSGVTFTDNGNGTATLSGTPTQAGAFSLTITANNGVGSAATQSFVLGVPVAPTISSANATTMTAGTAGNFTVTATGYPTPAFTETGTLPTGVSLVDLLNGTAELVGTPSAGSGGAYGFTITADNGVGTAATQSFTLTVDAAPVLTSTAGASFTTNTAGSFTVTTTGYPVPALTETGSLPAGVSFIDNGDGTATLSGTATAAGSFPLTITADNGVGTAAIQSFTLAIAAPAPPVMPGPGNTSPSTPASVTPAPAPATVLPAMPSGFAAPSTDAVSSGHATSVKTAAGATTASVTAPAGALPEGAIIAVAAQSGAPSAPSSLPSLDAPVTAFAVALSDALGVAQHAEQPILVQLTGGDLHVGDVVYATTPSGPEVIARVGAAGTVRVLVQDATALFVVAPPTTAVASRTVKADPHVAVVELSCTSGVRCVGTASVLSVARYPGGRTHQATHPALARAHFSLAAGHSQPFRFAMTAFGRKVLRRAISAWHQGRAHFGVTLLVRTQDGNRLVERVWLR